MKYLCISESSPKVFIELVDNARDGSLGSFFFLGNDKEKGVDVGKQKDYLGILSRFDKNEA